MISGKVRPESQTFLAPYVSDENLSYFFRDKDCWTLDNDFVFYELNVVYSYILLYALDFFKLDIISTLKLLCC